jgi:hypothetical protein
MAIRIIATPRTKSTDVMRDTLEGTESPGLAGLNDELFMLVVTPIFEGAPGSYVVAPYSNICQYANG